MTWTPTIENLPLWKDTFERRVISASALGRSRIRPWVTAIWTAKSEEDLAACEVYLEPLDDKIALCMTELAKSCSNKDPEPARRLQELSRRCKSKGYLSTGRQMVYTLVHYFDTDRHTGVAQSVFDLARAKWMGDSLEKV